MAESAPKVIFGGTFDPVHFGHLRTVLELCEWLQVPQIDLIPARDPVHKAATGADAQARYQMLQLACASEPRLSVSDLELRSSKDSYSIHTLTRLREQIGPQRPLVLVMGMDAFLGFTTWKEWERFLELCHLVVVQRPGYQPRLEARLEALVHEAEVLDVAHLKQSAHGCLMFHQLTPLEISSTHIREQIRAGESPRFLLPDSVWAYIQENSLYGFKGKPEH